MTQTETNLFDTENIGRVLLKMAPPVMLAQLIQALYNIVDSFFIGNYSDTGLTALSIIFPIQLLMIAFGVGTGVGINTVMAHRMGVNLKKESEDAAGMSAPLALTLWLFFAVVCYLILPSYAAMSTDSEAVIQDVIVYGRLVCVFSIGLFAESMWSKVLQANGDMKTPTIAQIAGAVTNIILDPILIFGMFGLPEFGIAGAAIATVSGQIVAALIVMPKGYRKSPALSKYTGELKTIYKLGTPSIIMQSAFTVYILGLNLILAQFSDAAVTALGLYYKWQAFFFIPMGALHTCIVPMISYNYAARRLDRCKKTLNTALVVGMALMALGTLCFVLIPGPMLDVFTNDQTVIDIGVVGFRWIGLSFIPAVTSLTYPVFFQAVGHAVKSSFLTVVRTILLFVPLGYLFAQISLSAFWLTFPVTETVTTLVGVIFYVNFCRKEARQSPLV